MSNIVCPECWASAIVNHQPDCSRPAYVRLCAECDGRIHQVDGLWRHMDSNHVCKYGLA